MTSVKNIFGASVAKAFKIIDYQDKNYEIMGLVSKKPQVQNNLQLLYVNKRVITKGMIHKVINDLLSNYIKQRGVFSKSSEESIIFKSGKHTASNAFILEIRCPVTYYELFTNVRKSTVEFKCWKDVLKCIRKAIKKPFSFGENITTSSTKVMKNETKNNNASKNKRKLGTSLLINAIKGMEARRKLRSKFNSKPCKIDSESYDERKSSTLFDESFKENSNSISKKNVHSQSTHKFFGDCTLDSMESPIPKKRLKSNLIKNYKCESKPETGEVTIHNQSFFQFYKWLKEEIKIDPDAFRFYQTYMQHKQQANNKIRTDHFSETGRKGTPVMENEIFRNIEKIYNNLRITEKKRTLNKNQYTNLHLTAKYSENQGIVNACHRKNLIDFSHGSNDIQGIWNCLLQSQNFKKNFQQFSKFDCGPIINNYKESSFQIGGKQAQVALRNAELSPAPSENFFSNFIRLRNLSHTLERQFLSKKGQCFIDDNDSLDCGTWISHYQNPLNLNTAYNQTAFEKEEFVSWVDHKVTKNFENFRKNDSKRKNLDVNHRTQNFLCNTAEPFDFRRPLYDVGIQYSKIDTSNINFCSGKKSVMVQTDKFIDIDNNTSASILSSAMNSEKILTPHESVGDRDPRKINKDIFQKLDQKTIQHKKKHESQADLNKEVPCPDFWNTSLTESFDKETNAPLFISDDSRAKKPPTLKSKYSLPSQPLCREQIIELETKMQESSLSKDMIATLWPECLNEFESFSDNADCVVKSSLSGVKSDSTELPKTIPIEELELSLPVTTQQQFCLAERHNFIPKGLSPKFLHADPTDVPALSPDKKNQIKLVVDDAENESLAYVKWRDESTGNKTYDVFTKKKTFDSKPFLIMLIDFTIVLKGGSIKSTIPGGILDEMRQKAERNLIYCENEIISASLSCNAIKVHNLLHSFAFTKELLSGVQVTFREIFIKFNCRLYILNNIEF